MMNVGIIDADLLDKGTRDPNLALMKISGYYKNKNDTVNLLTSWDEALQSQYDKIFVSKVFTQTKVNEDVMNLSNVEYGGTGFYYDQSPNLSDEIEHSFPDYHLYDDYVSSKIRHGGGRLSYYNNYMISSIGFATRGCFRKCDFCVNKKYDRAFLHSHIDEWFDPKRKIITLLDDNIFAYSKWNEVFDELDSTGKRFQFKQGLDIRLLTDKKADRLSKSKYYNDYIFAFDNINDRELIENKLSLWRNYSDKNTKLYVLCGYDSQDIDDVISMFERIKIIMSYKCLPYIMRHENYKKSEYSSLYTSVARWCNQPNFFKKKTFREFCELDQSIIKTKGKLCSSMRALTQIENSYPDVAKKYFDMRF